MMLRTGYWLTVAAGFVGYLLGPRATSTIGFLAGVAGWPTRLMRVVGIGWLDGLGMAVADCVVASVGTHRWLLALPILLVFGALTWWANRSGKRRIWILAEIVVTLLFAPFWSALFTGCHLARAAEVLDKPADAGRRSALWADLTLGMEPMSQEAPSRTARRLVRFSKRGILPIEQVADPKVAADIRRASESWRQFHAKIASLPARNRMISGPGGKEPDMGVLLYLTELSWRLSAGYLWKTALEGCGGDPEQPWREIAVRGPAGARIVLKTNILPPNPLKSMLIPNFEVGVEAARRRFADAVATISDPTTRELMSQFNVEPLKSLALDDTLFQIWYSLIPELPLVSSALERIWGLTPTFRDADGPLIVAVHNSTASYSRAVGARIDRGARGIYVRSENTIHVLQDEREATRHDAWSLLNAFTDPLDGSNSPAKRAETPGSKQQKGALEASIDEVLNTPGLQRMFVAMQLNEGLEVVYPHEVTHWMFAAAAANLPGGSEGLPACIHEGVALFVDQGFATRYRDMLRKMGAQRAAEELRDWRQIWLSLVRDVGRDQRALLSMSEADFGAEVGREAQPVYADCWIIVQTEGKEIFERMKAANVPLGAVLDQHMIPILDVPWRDLRAFARQSERRASAERVLQMVPRP
jgi:hypothetical protein